MAIEVVHLAKARGGFERLPNEAIRNVELSIAAVGLLARLLADGHAFNSIDALADFFGGGEGAERKRGTGRDAYRAAARELEAAGHLVRVRIVINGLPAWRLQVFAEAYASDVHSIPMTAKPLPMRPAETVHTPRSRPTTAKPLPLSPAETMQNPSSTPTTAEPLSVPPAETTHSRSSRPTTAKPSSFLTDFSTDRQTSSPTTPSASPPDWAAAALGVGEEVQEEGEGFEEHPTDENTARAIAFVDRLPFDRNPTTAERADLVYLVGLWFKAGWSHDALMAKCEAGLDTAHDRIGAWIKFRLAADKVCKPPAVTTSGHQTFRNPDPSGYGPPKKHQGWQNPTEPDAYDGSF